MTATEASQETSRQGADAVACPPAVVRHAVAVMVVVGLGSAAYLWAVRGPALLLDLAHMGAKFLCL